MQGPLCIFIRSIPGYASTSSCRKNEKTEETHRRKSRRRIHKTIQAATDIDGQVYRKNVGADSVSRASRGKDMQSVTTLRRYNLGAPGQVSDEILEPIDVNLTPDVNVDTLAGSTRVVLSRAYQWVIITQRVSCCPLGIVRALRAPQELRAQRLLTGHECENT